MKDESANIKNAVVSLLLELFVISVFFVFFFIFPYILYLFFFLQFKGTIDTIIIESISIEMIDERYDVFLLQNIAKSVIQNLTCDFQQDLCVVCKNTLSTV